MKTAIAYATPASPLTLVKEQKLSVEKGNKKVVWKTDLRNHRFAVIDNKSVQDPTNWDEAWFGNYE